MAESSTPAAPHDRPAANPLRHLPHLLQHPPAAPLPEPTHPSRGLSGPTQSHPTKHPGTSAAGPVRRDIFDTHGKLSLRHHGRLHHIGVGRTHARTPILMLINGLDIHIIHATTGEIIKELILNPDIDYQAQGIRKPRPKPS